MLTSTDKAVHANTLYGGSKFVAERLLIASNNLGRCRFSICRYANVVGSTGSVNELWHKQAAYGEDITITHPAMTRMFLSKEEAAAFIVHKLGVMVGGEIFVPKLTGKSMLAMAKTIADSKNVKVKDIGLRPHEKIHEDLIGDTDARDCYENKDDNGNPYYILYPPFHNWAIALAKRGKKMPESFRLSSRE